MGRAVPGCLGGIAGTVIILVVKWSRVVRDAVMFAEIELERAGRRRRRWVKGEGDGGWCGHGRLR